MGSANAVAAQLLELPDQEPKCLTTRSARGVEDAFLKIQSLKDQCTKVSTSEFEDPGTKVLRFKPTGSLYSVDDLRTMMGLDSVLQDRQVLTADYYDRYFEKQRGQYAHMFAKLLSGPWLASDSQVTIHTNQLREEFQDNHDLTRQDAIQEQLKDFPHFRLRWRNYNVPGPKLEHARTLKITFAEDFSLLVTFDKGLDFVRRRWGTDQYEVTEKTYVMVEHV